MFRGLGVRDLLKIMRVVYEVNLAEGEALERPSGANNCMYIVASGTVELSHQGKAIGTCEKGDHFGEDALYDNIPSNVDVKCKDEALLLAVPARRFRAIVTDEPAVGNVLLWNLLEAATERVRAAEGRSASE